LSLPLETEIKIRISGVPAIRGRVRKLGFRIHARRVFESNVILDTSGQGLGAKGELIRIRRAGGKSIVTYKGPPQGGQHKSREEIETAVANPEALEIIFARLGFHPVFRYEKYRTEYSRPGKRGVITVDETPVGDYLEIEGAPKWIDATARELGFAPPDYITQSYGALYLQYCRDHSIRPTQMIFRPAHPPTRKGHGRTPETKKTKLP
jgi:adenylate cyclase, class 2